MLIFAVIIHQIFATIESKDQTGFYKGLNEKVDFYTESGHISQGKSSIEDNALFYMLYLKKGTMAIGDIKTNDPFVLWIEGGPGCAGVYSSFTQHGPFHVESDQRITLRDYGWNEQAHLIYIDQPFGTGLSYNSEKQLVDNSYTAMNYVVDALQQFFEKYPQFKQTPFYICGESYGGHYVPVLATKIFTSGLNEKINYKGIMIGGAWTYPTKQISQIPSQLFSFGMIDQLRFNTLTNWSIQSLEYINQKKYNEFLELSDELFFAEQFLGPNFRYSIFQLYIYRHADL